MLLVFLCYKRSNQRTYPIRFIKYRYWILNFKPILLHTYHIPTKQYTFFASRFITQRVHRARGRSRGRQQDGAVKANPSGDPGHQSGVCDHLHRAASRGRGPPGGGALRRPWVTLLSPGQAERAGLGQQGQGECISVQQGRR